MTLPEIPPAHREAVINALRDTPAILSGVGLLASFEESRADIAIATLLRLGYRVAPGWVRTSDRRPEVGQFVLGYGKGCAGTTMAHDPCMMVMYWDESWWDANDDFEMYHGRVECWCPLPPPPSSAPEPTTDNNKDANTCT